MDLLSAHSVGYKLRSLPRRKTRLEKRRVPEGRGYGEKHIPNGLH